MGLGEYHTQDKVFTFDEEGWLRTFGERNERGEIYSSWYIKDHPTKIMFGHASDPESLESATAKAAWLDECGQRAFKRESYEAILRRLSLSKGRVLATTTPYELGWMKQEFHDRWKAGDPDYDFINFDSTENPSFPKGEFERARNSLPAWKFDLFYRGIYTRPAGMIYDCFVDELSPNGHLVKRFAIPDRWPRFLGLDFGGVNTAGVFIAEELDTDGRRLSPRRFYAYREYKAGGRTAGQHAKALLEGEPKIPVAVGGSHSEEQWRQEFRQGGRDPSMVNIGEGASSLPVREPPIKDVEVGIDRVYGAIKEDQLFVFDDLLGLRGQLMAYSRELDDAGEPTEKIEDKETYHFLDALRYVGSVLFGQALPGSVLSGGSPIIDRKKEL